MKLQLVRSAGLSRLATIPPEGGATNDSAPVQFPIAIRFVFSFVKKITAVGVVFERNNDSESRATFCLALRSPNEP